jgi:hypothetical protein
VQRIVRAYERYNQQIGAGRQLTLKLGGDTPESQDAPGAAEEIVPATPA